MPGLADALHGEGEGDIRLMPLGTHMKTMSDVEIIHNVSEFEARRQYCRWTINAATVAYYDHLIKEWEGRHGDRHIPRKVFPRQEIIGKYLQAWPPEEDE